MSSAKPALGSDWTKILSDPAIASHMGELLKAYREAPADKRNQVLLDRMREIKGSKVSQTGTSSTTEVTKAAPAAVAPPPFQPDFFQPNRSLDRRQFPRMKCFVAVELRLENAQTLAWGNLCNISPGGCFVETATSFDAGVHLDIGLWIANGELWVKGLVLNGVVMISAPTAGLRIKFSTLSSTERETLNQFLKYVAEATREQEHSQSYLSQMKR
jgi:hypothetical protein